MAFAILDYFKASWSYIQRWQTDHSVLDFGHYELEYQLYDTPMMLEMAMLGGKLYTAESSAGLSTPTYIDEIYIKNSTVKYRSRQDFKNVSVLEKNPEKLSQNAHLWIRKTRIDTAKLHANFDLSLSIEEHSGIPNKTDNHKMNLTQCLQYSVADWKIDFKLKYNIKMNTPHLVNRILSYADHPTMTCEIEFLKPLHSLSETNMKQLYDYILNYVFQTKIEYLYFNTKDYDFLKSVVSETITMYHKEILLDSKYEQYRVTPKIDGYMCLFHNKDYRCTFRGTESSFVCIVPSSFAESFNGHAEKLVKMVNHTEVFHLFPYLVVWEDHNLSRWESVDRLRDLIDSSKQTSPIQFHHKPFYSWTSKEEMCQRIIDSLSYKDYPIDGCIIADPLGKVDIKWKDNDTGSNTIDLLATININQSSFITQDNTLVMNLYFKQDTNIGNVRKIIAADGSIFNYDRRRGIFSTTIDQLTFLHYHKCIVECNVNYDIVRIRFDKTNKFYRSGYLGNPSKIIELQKSIAREAISIDDLQKLAISFDLNQIVRSDVKVNQGCLLLNALILSRLIVNDVQSKQKSNIINWFKSEWIYLSCSPIFAKINKTKVERVLIIDGGLGTDITKYNKIILATTIVITDPAASSINIVNNYIANMNQDSHKTNIKYINTGILYDDFLDSIDTNRMIFNVIDWQLAIEYSWTESTKDKIMRKLDYLSAVGTMIFITAIDGTMLKKSLQEKSLSFKINNDFEEQYDRVNDELYNYTINNRVDNSLQAFYVEPSDLVNTFHKHKYHLWSSGLVLDYIKANECMFVNNSYQLEDVQSTALFLKSVKSSLDYAKTNPDLLNSITMLRYYSFIRES